MKRDLMTLFGDQLRWFARLNRKQRLCALYFCLSFGILLSVVFDHPTAGASRSVELRGFSETDKEACPLEWFRGLIIKLEDGIF